MAQADRLFTDEPLPPEGRTLGEIVKRVVSREAWDFLTDMVGDQPSEHSRQLQWFRITPKALVHLPPDGLYANAVRACLPIVDRWNCGAWIAKGRRGGLIEPPVGIPPPATGYQLVVGSLARSVIFEPGSNYYKRIYDLRFYSPATLTPEPPLLVRHDGPIEIIERRDNEPAHYQHIREVADLAFPRGWRHLRQVVVLKGVADQLEKLNEPVPERQMLLRALGYRKD
jgi:hypothetical protein